MAGTILQIAERTIRMEAGAINGLLGQLNEDFVKAVEAIAAMKGRLVVSGIGKSAAISQKIVATLNSTGTPAIFMHAADAIHGDLGMIQADDIVLVISKSGNSPEIKVLIPLLRNFGNILIAMVGNMNSYLAQQATIRLDCTVEQEACPNNLAPTTSTTAQLVLGDALAIALMEIKGFSSDDFAKFHPGGTLGKKLYLRVQDLYPQNEQPAVQPTQGLKDVIMEISAKRLGVTAVTDEAGQLLGIITDGDLRRMLEQVSDLETVTAAEIMTKNPKTIQADQLAVHALELMRTHSITQLAVVENEQYRGIIHLHDLIREGLI